jgi:hypothetical protein
MFVAMYEHPVATMDTYTRAFTLLTVVPVEYRNGHKRAREHCKRNVDKMSLVWSRNESPLLGVVTKVPIAGSTLGHL